MGRGLGAESVATNAIGVWPSSPSSTVTEAIDNDGKSLSRMVPTAVTGTAFSSPPTTTSSVSSGSRSRSPMIGTQIVCASWPRSITSRPWLA